MNRVIVPILMFTASIFSAILPSHAEDNVTTEKYVCNDLDGNKRWEAEATTRSLGKKNTYILTEEGNGIYFGFDCPVSWKAETEFSDDGEKIAPLRMKKTVMSADGRTLFEGAQEFDAEKGEVTCLKRWTESGKEVKKSLRYKGDVVNDLLLGRYVKRFLKNGDRQKTFYLVTNDPDIYRIRAAIKDEEELDINGNKVTAYKIKIAPQGGLAAMFAPPTYVWHLAREKFNWLKYKGAEDTLDSPEVEMETLERI